MEVIEAGFGVVDVAAVAEGVMDTESRSKGSGGAEGIAPGIVGVLDYCCSASIEDGSYIALQVGDIVICRAVVGQGQRCTGRIVAEVQRIAPNGHTCQLAADVDVAIGGAAVGSLGAHTIGIVSVSPGGAAVGHTLQFPATLPGVGPSAVGEHIADGVAGDGDAVIAGEQVAPGIGGVAIGHRILDSTQGASGVGILTAGEDVAGVVVGPGVGEVSCLVVLPDQLVLAMVCIRSGRCPRKQRR